MGKAKELKEKATKLREAAKLADKKAKEAATKKAKDAAKLKEAADKCEKDAVAAEAAAIEAEKAEAEGEDGGGDDGSGHDDADQDKELIKKMLDEYVGKSDDMDKKEREAMESLAHEAYQAHKELGKEDKDALHHAGEAVKLARHMASKQTEAETETESEDDAAAAAKAKDAKDKDGGDGDDDDKSEADKKVESKRVKELEKKLLEANGRLAALETSNKKSELTQHIDKVLKESGQPNSITKRFREAAGDFKSVKDFDSKWSIFLEGVKNQARTVIDWGPIAEKSLMHESDGEGSGKGGLDFSSAADDEDEL